MPPSKKLASDITDDDLSSGEIEIQIRKKTLLIVTIGKIIHPLFVESLVSKRNEHANRVINANRLLRRRSTWNSWTDVNVPDMKKFIELIFSMGLISLPSYKKYWSKELLYKNEHFPSVMSRERFESIF